MTPIPPRISAVISAVAAEFRVSVDDILGSSVRRRITRPRQEAMRRVRLLRMPDGFPPSYPQIGAWFGKDHTTVVYACRTLKESDLGARVWTPPAACNDNDLGPRAA